METLLSIVSIAITVILAIAVYKQNVKINAITLRSRFFEKIFDEYLIKNIPRARKFITYDNTGTLNSHRSLIDELRNLKNDSLYFKYTSPEFYKKLISSIDSIETFISGITTETDIDSQARNILEIGNLIEKLYACIDEEFTGRK